MVAHKASFIVLINSCLVIDDRPRLGPSWLRDTMVLGTCRRMSIRVRQWQTVAPCAQWVRINGKTIPSFFCQPVLHNIEESRPLLCCHCLYHLHKGSVLSKLSLVCGIQAHLQVGPSLYHVDLKVFVPTLLFRVFYKVQVEANLYKLDLTPTLGGNAKKLFYFLRLIFTFSRLSNCVF